MCYISGRVHGAAPGRGVLQAAVCATPAGVRRPGRGQGRQGTTWHVYGLPKLLVEVTHKIHQVIKIIGSFLFI